MKLLYYSGSSQGMKSILTIGQLSKSSTHTVFYLDVLSEHLYVPSGHLPSPSTLVIFRKAFPFRKPQILRLLIRDCNTGDLGTSLIPFSSNVERLSNSVYVMTDSWTDCSTRAFPFTYSS